MLTTCPMVLAYNLVATTKYASYSYRDDNSKRGQQERMQKGCDGGMVLSYFAAEPKCISCDKQQLTVTTTNMVTFKGLKE